MFDAQTSPIMLIYSSRRGGSRVEGPTTASARRTAPTFLVVVLATLIAVGCSSERTPSSPEVARSPVVVAVGDIAADCRREAHEGKAHEGTAGATAELLNDIRGTVLALGDLALPRSSAESFRECYDLSWGLFKWRTRPVPGNREYYTEEAKGYFDYFGEVAGEPGKGYYSYDLGDWHLLALNSNCEEVGGCDASSAQVRWLKADLAANKDKTCTLAYMHHPLYASGREHDSPHVKPFWTELYNHHADVILSGSAHRYERFARITPSGKFSSARGIRQFIVGTGGS